MNKDTTYKKFSIYLTINQMGSTLFEQQEYKFVVHVNILITRKLFKKNYRVKMFVSKLDNNDDHNNKLNNSNSSILNSNLPIMEDDLKSIGKVEQDGNLILFKSVKSCNI